MAVARRSHIISSSAKSFQDALNEGVSRAAKTLHGITGVEIISQKAKVEDDRISEYRIECYVTFVLDE